MSKGIIENFKPWYDVPIDVYRVETCYPDQGWLVSSLSTRNSSVSHYGPWVFYKDTHHQMVKEYFWKTFKFDIDKCGENPNYQRRLVSCDPIAFRTSEYEREIRSYQHDIQVFEERIKLLKEQQFKINGP